MSNNFLSCANLRKTAIHFISFQKRNTSVQLLTSSVPYEAESYNVTLESEAGSSEIQSVQTARNSMDSQLLAFLILLCVTTGKCTNITLS